MIKLASASGTAIYESNNRLYISKIPGQWTSTFLFVAGLLAFILFSNGVLMLFFLKTQPAIPQSLGISLIAIGVLLVFIFWKVNVYRKKLHAKPVSELKCICIIDLNNNTLLDEQQNMLASLDQVQLSRKMQLTSSSPSLVLLWNKNALTLVQGNPFSGDIAAIEQTLISKGIKRK